MAQCVNQMGWICDLFMEDSQVQVDRVTVERVDWNLSHEVVTLIKIFFQADLLTLKFCLVCP